MSRNCGKPYRYCCFILTVNRGTFDNVFFLIFFYCITNHANFRPWLAVALSIFSVHNWKIALAIGRDFSDVTSSAGFWRKRTASHCVECMAQLSDATIRAIVLRMLLLTAMAPWQADRGSLELSIDACFVKIGQGDHLLRLLCGLWSCFSTCSVHCQSWKRRFLDSTASVL